MLFGEEAVDVHTQCAAAVQHGCRQPCFTAALDLLQDPALDALIAPPVSFSDLPSRLPDILNPTSGVLCQLIRY